MPLEAGFLHYRGGSETWPGLVGVDPSAWKVISLCAVAYRIEVVLRVIVLMCIAVCNSKKEMRLHRQVSINAKYCRDAGV